MNTLWTERWDRTWNNMTPPPKQPRTERERAIACTLANCPSERRPNPRQGEVDWLRDWMKRDMATPPQPMQQKTYDEIIQQLRDERDERPFFLLRFWWWIRDTFREFRYTLSEWIFP